MGNNGNVASPQDRDGRSGRRAKKKLAIKPDHLSISSNNDSCEDNKDRDRARGPLKFSSVPKMVGQRSKQGPPQIISHQPSQIANKE